MADDCRYKNVKKKEEETEKFVVSKWCQERLNGIAII